MPTTSTAEVLFPSVAAFIIPFFHNASRFAQLPALQTAILSQPDCGLQPKLRFTVSKKSRDADLLRKGRLDPSEPSVVHPTLAIAVLGVRCRSF
jgi:hypothetical protein